MIQTKNLSKIYNEGKSNECRALDSVNLEIKDGEFVAIMGKSGSGKSTLMHLIAGVDYPTSGQVEIDGKEINKLSEKQLSQFRNKEVGIIMQQFFLIEECSVIENVRMPLDFSKEKIKDKDERAVKLICQMGLKDYVKKKVRELSGGEKQRVAIARALVNDPEILLADEPTGSLDSENSDNIMQLMQRINQKFNKTIIVITHEQDIAKYCDRLIVLSDGKIISDEAISH